MQLLDGLTNEDVHLRFGKINSLHNLLTSYAATEDLVDNCHSGYINA